VRAHMDTQMLRGGGGQRVAFYIIHTRAHTHTNTHAHTHTHTHTHTHRCWGAGAASVVWDRAGSGRIASADAACCCCFRMSGVYALTCADVCWRMLVPDGLLVLMLHAVAPSGCLVCMRWCMLTYADVCWRMLTYADVCWRMLMLHMLLLLQDV